MKKIFFLFFAIFALNVYSDNLIKVQSFRYVGPFSVQSPLLLDSTNVKGEKWEESKLLNTKIDLEQIKQGSLLKTVQLPIMKSHQIHLVGFSIKNRSFFAGEIKLIKHPSQYKLYLDDKELTNLNVSLTPGCHNVVMKYLSQKDLQDSLEVELNVMKGSAEIVDIAQGKDIYTIEKMYGSELYNKIQLSPSGKYALVGSYYRRTSGVVYRNRILELATGNFLCDVEQNCDWMPKTERYLRLRKNSDGEDYELQAVCPTTGRVIRLASHLPFGNYTISPNEDFLIGELTDEGPKKDANVFEIIHPDDRQSGWRDRTYLVKCDIKTGLITRLTHNYNNVWLNGIENDGNHILFSKQESRLTARPTSLTSLYRLDLTTMQVDTLINKDGFVRSAVLSPDNKKVAVVASPEAFKRIGCTLPEDKYPNEYDYLLYILDIQTKQVQPVTQGFKPSIQKCEWNAWDNCIYFMAEHSDSVSIFRMDPKQNYHIQKLQIAEDVAMGFSVASQSPLLMYYGESATNSVRLYSMNTRAIEKKKIISELQEDINGKDLENTEMAICKPWTFVNSIGDTIICRYYLPDNFDTQKKYPMIVYYYGGCVSSPRNLESTYPQACWASLGYVCLVVQPSGAAGFGQEFGSRHVNTAGEDPARDIIEATKKFCATHSYVDSKKLGCIGASYGGFMTQYLQTVTDIFRCAVSHAGISDHTTYWGYGYWGYNYSEVSMANNYPWTNKKLYVDHSPIYNVDKIHTPILFLHGTKDTNVPINNSIQMFTALKLLGRDVAMVNVEGENHGIRDYAKRIKWYNTYMAWFAKWLQDDSSWWDNLYPKQTL